MPILLMLVSVTAIRSQETTPMSTTPIAASTPEILPVPTGVCDTVAHCRERIDVLNARLLKTINDLNAAIANGTAKDDVIAAAAMVRGLYVEGMAIKDQFIKDVMADNDFLRKQVHPSKSWIRKFAERVEKLVIFAAAFYLGGK